MYILETDAKFINKWGWSRYGVKQIDWSKHRCHSRTKYWELSGAHYVTINWDAVVNYDGTKDN